MDEQTPNYYGTVPASVRYDKELTPSAKLLYAEVSALTNMRGICWATNAYFAKLYDVNERQVTRWISQLKARGHIRTKVIEGGFRGVSILVEGRRKRPGGGDEKDDHNTTVTNKKKNKQKKLNPVPDSFLVEQPPSFNGSPTAAQAGAVIDLLKTIIENVNPREKVTTERVRMLHARLKDYTEAEILEASGVFSQSKWHRDNGQMSIDNLLAPSKFGRWYAKRGEVDNSEPDPDDDGLTQAQREVKLAEALEKEREWRRQNGLD